MPKIIKQEDFDFIDLLHSVSELLSLTEGNIARYNLTLSAFSAWQKNG